VEEWRRWMGLDGLEGDVTREIKKKKREREREREIKKRKRIR
jgi:hypothetical protein